LIQKTKDVKIDKEKEFMEEVRSKRLTNPDDSKKERKRKKELL
jgi:hypothetical protein